MKLSPDQHNSSTVCRHIGHSVTGKRQFKRNKFVAPARRGVVASRDSFWNGSNLAYSTMARHATSPWSLSLTWGARSRHIKVNLERRQERVLAHLRTVCKEAGLNTVV